MEKLKFIKPTKEYEEAAYEYIQEFNDYNSNINGTGGLHRYMQHYDEWLQKLEQDRKATEDRVPAETFMLIRESDNRILGMVNIRLGLNKALLQHGGNIGYSVRPTERKKGYNTYQLYCALQFCKEQGLDKVLLTCKKDNVGSSKTIQHYGGILENEFFDSSDGSITLRYWIDVEEGLKIGAKQYKDKQKVLK